MSLSRKRKKELKRLRASAEDLWNNQQVVIDHANNVAREASRQLSHITREQVAPRVREGYEQYLRPGVDATRSLARSAGDVVDRRIVPALGTAVGSVLAIGDVANDTRVQKALARMNPRAAVVEEKKPGFGTYLAIGAGIVAAGAVAYAVWQTFRADDELWVADDEPEVTAT